MTIESVLKELLGEHFSKVSEFHLKFVRSCQNEDGVRKTFDYLQKLDLTKEKIAKQAHLLGRNPKTIQIHYDNLISKKISSEKIAKKKISPRVESGR